MTKITFSDAADQLQLIAGAPVLSGTIERVPTVSNPKKKNGWYSVVEINGNIYGTVGNWETGEQIKIEGNGADYQSNKEWIIAAERARQETAEKQQKAASAAEKVVRQSQQADKSHPYLLAKGILSNGALQTGDKLLLPIYSPDGEITSYQTISPSGEKRFLFGGRKKGCCSPIKGTASQVCICEGFATGASIFEATGCTVLVAFDAGNLLPVAEEAVKKYPESRIIICADNDHAKAENVGLAKGRFAAAETGCQCVWPTGITGTDFNDMAVELGHDAVRNAIVKGLVIETYKKEDLETNTNEIDRIIETAPAVLQDIVKFYADTAIRAQPAMALATGLAFGSVVMGRRFRTDLNNYTSAYFAIIASSGVGKDHPKNTIRTMLRICGLAGLERSGGYTAANTVIKSLANSPLQITFLEEMGTRLHEAATRPNSSMMGMFRQFLDVFSSCHSYVVGDEYSDGSIPRVDNPALTIVGMSTTHEFFKAINERLIEQGFVNRIIPFIVDIEREAIDLRPGMADVAFPESVKEWTAYIWPHAFEVEVGGIPEATEIRITDSAYKLLNEIEIEVVAQAKALEKHRLSDLPSRNRELVLRLSLICAGMNRSETIRGEYVEWSWKLIKYLYAEYINKIKRFVSGSEFEAAKLECLMALRKAGEKGVRPGDMAKTAPFSKYDRKTRSEILSELSDSGLAAQTQVKTGKRGPLTTVWVALK